MSDEFAHYMPNLQILHQALIIVTNEFSYWKLLSKSFRYRR
mgnify:CR=1 FL=1